MKYRGSSIMPVVLGVCVFVVPYCLLLALLLLKLTMPERPNVERPRPAYKQRIPRGRKPLPAYHLRIEDLPHDQRGAA